MKANFSEYKTLVIELSLYDRKKKVFSILPFEFHLTDGEIENAIIETKSFFRFKNYISQENKNLLAVVYNKAFDGLMNRISIPDYDITKSHLYFAYLSDKDETLFSAPHITSPIIFNPNDTTGTYTLDQTKRAEFSSFNKRLANNIATYEYNKALTKADIIPIYQNISMYDIVNSLFDYYTLNGYNYISWYSNERNQELRIGLNPISSFEIRNFLYINND